MGTCSLIFVLAYLSKEVVLQASLCCISEVSWILLGMFLSSVLHQVLCVGINYQLTQVIFALWWMEIDFDWNLETTYWILCHDSTVGSVIDIDFQLLELLLFAEWFSHAFVLVFHFRFTWLCFQCLQLTYNLMCNQRLRSWINLSSKMNHRALWHLRLVMKINDPAFQLFAGAVPTWSIVFSSTAIRFKILFIEQVNITLALIILIQLFVVLFNFVFCILIVLVHPFLLLLLIYAYLRIDTSCVGVLGVGVAFHTGASRWKRLLHTLRREIETLKR